MAGDASRHNSFYLQREAGYSFYGETMTRLFCFLLFFGGLIIPGERGVSAPMHITLMIPIGVGAQKHQANVSSDNSHSEGKSAITLYLHHKLLDIKILEKDKDFLVSLSDILNYLDLKWEEENGNYHIFVPGMLWIGKETAKGASEVMINGQAVTNGVFKSKGIVFVALNKFASFLGLAFIISKETGIADLFKPVSSKLEGPKEKPVNEGDAPSKKEEILNGDDPYRLEGFNYHEELNTREVRAFATLRNISSKPLTGVVATAKYLDGNRVPIITHTTKVGELQPGASKELEFFWINTTNVWVKVEIDVEWNGKPKQR